MNRFPDKARVAFIGDSITHGNNYTSRIIAQYRAALPDCGITFRNCGISGGSAGSALLFFEKDIAPFAPTHATVMLGVNDSCRDALGYADKAEGNRVLEEAFKTYQVNMRLLCDGLDAMGTKVTLLTPIPYAEFQKSPQPALPGGEALISRYANEVCSLAAERGYDLIDLHKAFLTLYRNETLYGDDHIHPTDPGHYRMAELILRAQGLSVPPFEPIEALRERAGLTDWALTVGHLRDLYATEWMIVRKFDASDEEKLLTAQEYVTRRGWGDFAYFEHLSTDYLLYKKKQPALEAAASIRV